MAYELLFGTNELEIHQGNMEYLDGTKPTVITENIGERR